MVWGRENVSHSISKLLKDRSLYYTRRGLCTHAQLAEARHTDPEIGVPHPEGKKREREFVFPPEP